MTTGPQSYVFSKEERPVFPGSPFAPRISTGRRIAYVAAACVTGIGSTLGNALTNVNVGTISGSLGLYVAEATVLPAIYVAMNAGANLTLIRARAQFGIPQVTLVLLTAYALAAILQLIVPGFAAAVVIRGVNGMSAAALVTLTIYFLLEVFPVSLRPIALVIGIGLTQLGPALARIIPVELLADDHWHGLHLFELALALTLIAVVALARLPPSERSRAFEWLDVVTIGLLVSGLLSICQVIGQGRVRWWTDSTGLGWTLAIAVPLLAAAFIIESLRARPLIRLDWLGSLGMIRFAAVAFLVRIALAEQTYGSVGLLTSGGLTNDQLRLLFACVSLAMIGGIAVAALTLSPQRLPWQVICAALVIAFGAWLDTSSNNLTRPSQLILSQTLIGFGTTLFVGPALVYGFLQMFQRGGADFFVSFVVLFSTTQNVGGLAGSALLGTWQTIAARAHAGALSEHLIASNPDVSSRLSASAAGISGVVSEASAQAAQGAGLLSQALSREANVLAFIDTFQFVMIVALAAAAIIALRLAFQAATKLLARVAAPSPKQT
jgi:hypothetical protein